jgi:hypothetical protein
MECKMFDFKSPTFENVSMYKTYMEISSRLRQLEVSRIKKTPHKVKKSVLVLLYQVSLKHLVQTLEEELQLGRLLEDEKRQASAAKKLPWVEKLLHVFSVRCQLGVPDDVRSALEKMEEFIREQAEGAGVELPEMTEIVREASRVGAEIPEIYSAVDRAKSYYAHTIIHLEYADRVIMKGEKIQLAEFSDKDLNDLLRAGAIAETKPAK